MRLLKRDNAGGVTFTKDLSEAELADPVYRYAILSHRWGPDEEEISYEDVLNGIATSKPGTGCEKIRFCVQQSRQDGLEYFWVDTCCIDKSKETELSRALRSMFRWYANAEKCYVFLADVPQAEQEGEEDGANWEQDFRFSAWFKRGWTLQELIAPAQLEFYSRHGRSLGTRQSLETQISEITRIPVKAFRGQSLGDFTTHERRQWQEGRQTREPEDMVYSMLGLLNISMPIMYGEGLALALQRLENEISIAQRGPRYDDFSLAFSLSEAAADTPHFVARQTELQEIRANLSSDGSRKIVVLHGLGGIGKTQLAIAYAKRYRDNYSAILWLNAKSEDSVKSSFLRMAKRIRRERPSTLSRTNPETEEDLDEVVDTVKAWLSMPMNTRWLLICDNYDNPKIPGDTQDATALELRQYLPEAYQGSVLLTTRSSEVKLGHRIHITKLEVLQDSLEILEHASDRMKLAEDGDAIQLAKRLDGMPLALATAGAYLSQSAITFAEYLHFWDQSWARLQKYSPALVTYEDRRLYSTWQVSYEQIEQRNSLSARLLRLWAYLDNQDVWFELLDHHFSHEPEWMRELSSSKLDFHASAKVLCNHGLAEANGKNEFETESMGYSIHACIHAWISAVLITEADTELAKIAVERVASHAVPDEVSPKGPLMERRLLNHVVSCSIILDNDRDGSLPSWTYHAFANLYSNHGKLAVAESLYQRALHGSEMAHGKDHRWTLDTVNNLATVYRERGKLKDAELMYQRALEGREKVFGSEHLITFGTMNNLGLLYTNQGRLEEAEMMMQRALNGKERLLGPDHWDTLMTADNLGLIYREQKRLSEAESMYLRALKGQEEALGPEHLSTLRTMYNLGTLYYDQGKLVESEGLHQRALRGRMKALGPAHARTLDSLHYLGMVYHGKDMPEEAESMYRQAIQGRETTLGVDHPETLASVNNLGNTLMSQHQFTDAQALFHRALQGQEKQLGLDHASTLASITNLGAVYERQGKRVEAIAMYQRALPPGRERWNVTTLKTANNLGILYCLERRLDEAEALYHRGLAGYEQAFGPNPRPIEFVWLYENLGILYHNQGKLEAAEEMYQRTLRSYEEALGPRHVKTLKLRENMAMLYRAQGKLAEAIIVESKGGWVRP